MHANVRYNKLSNRDNKKRPTKISIPVDETDDMDPIMLSRKYSDDENDDEDDVEGDAHSSKHITFYANTWNHLNC